MANRYEENRERFETGRSQEAGQRGEFERGSQNRGYGRGGGRADWGSVNAREREDEGQYADYGRPGSGADYRGAEFWQGGQRGEEGRENQRHYGENYGARTYAERGMNDRGFEEGGRGNLSEGRQRAWDWDRSRERGMTMSYPQQNEWSAGHGVSSGLGGAENSEYATHPRAGSYYGGQGQFGGGLSQFGDQGRYAGRGPKGYKRSDERIREDVNERLTQDPHIDAGEIEVEVKDGEVTLSGTVESRNMKRRAEDLIENISGVREVHNQLRAHAGQETSMAANTGTTTGAGKQGTQNREHKS